MRTCVDGDTELLEKEVDIGIEARLATFPKHHQNTSPGEEELFQAIKLEEKSACRWLQRSKIDKVRASGPKECTYLGCRELFSRASKHNDTAGRDLLTCELILHAVKFRTDQPQACNR